MKGRLLFTLLFIISASTLAQKQIHNWYFGSKAAISFNSGVPVAVTGSAMDQFEGSASVSDSSGNLLFYTDGMTIWNRNHVPLPNGTGLYGDYSTTQSAFILEAPGKPGRYYVFTVDNNGEPNGLSYSVVDMNGDQGLGEVIQKNVSLIPHVTEKITAARHANGTDYWIVVHGIDNDFYSFRLTGDGVSVAPVISRTGSFHANRDGAVGYMKMSPSGDRLAVAVSNRLILELFDFDNESGMVSDPVTLENYTTFYGLEFSPDETLLYLSDWVSGHIYQIDLTAQDIMGSLKKVAYASNGVGSLQRGPDNKIYVCRSYCNYLGVISFPDKRGSECGYVDDAVCLGDKAAMWGLPNISPTVFNNFTMAISSSQHCAGGTTVFTGTISFIPDSVCWSFGDTTAVSRTGKDLRVSHSYGGPGEYKVRLSAYYMGRTYNQTYKAWIHPLPEASVAGKEKICLGESTELKAAGGLTYLWSNGARENINIVRPLKDSTFHVTVSDMHCSATAFLRVTPVQRPEPPAAVGAEGCQGSKITLLAYNAEGDINWYADNEGRLLLKQGKELTPATDSAGSFTFYCAAEREGCNSLKIPVTLNVRPAPEISFHDIPELMIRDNPVGLKAEPAGGVFSGKGVRGALFDPALAGEGEHTISYTVKGKYGCMQTQSFTVKVKAGCGFYSSFFDNDIYPNPGTGLFRVCPESKLALALQMKFTALNVFNSSGTLVFSEGNLSKMINGELMDLTGLANGVYLVQLVTLDEVISRKVMINR
jgi:hypothetical protein